MDWFDLNEYGSLLSVKSAYKVFKLGIHYIFVLTNYTIKSSGCVFFNSFKT